MLLAVWLIIAALAELALRIIDFRVLRDTSSERSVSYRHDDELGWAPVPDSITTVTAERPIQVRHNSLGLRDRELAAPAKPRIMFVGDSFVWGNDVEAEERFTELLRPGLAGYDVVNAGVSGYGTDQALLLLQRLWSKVEPAVVVLMVTLANDRLDNTSNVRYDGYFKPYFATLPDGRLQLSGQPVPKPRHLYFKDHGLVRNLWLARAAIFAYTELGIRTVTVPDPTERLIALMRQFVEAKGAKFLVGLQYPEPQLVGFLEAQKIPFTSFERAATYQTIEHGFHWTPDGHALVAKNLAALLADTGLDQPPPRR